MKKDHKLTWSEVRGIVLVILGGLALGFYYSWWFTESRQPLPWLIVSLVIAVVYGLVQIVGNWALYLATHRRERKRPFAAGDLTVDVYITACGEDPALVERTLTAAIDMKGPHRTFLLDDGEDPALERLTARLGAGYLTRPDRRDAKAGNLNAALPRTDGDIIVIFDIDHVPHPDFLARTVGYFADPEIGFVQVMLTFANNEEGWVAQAAGDSSLDYYNPTSIGSDGMRSTTLVGSNALIRRQALDSIGGYQPGLAEDLATSIALHAAGWQSVYVREPLAPGMAPPDLAAWFTQQLKWARGVFELLLTAYPRHFRRLRAGQRIAYAVRMTYYWIGPVIALHMLATLIALWRGSSAALSDMEQYLLHLAPLGMMTVGIRFLALRRWRHHSIPNNLQWKPLMLVFATWPIYSLAWLMAMLRVPLGFRATPKSKTGQLNREWLLPQWISTLFLAGGVIYAFAAANLQAFLLVLGFAVGQIGVQTLLFFHQARLRTLAQREARRQRPFASQEVAPVPVKTQTHDTYRRSSQSQSIWQ